MSSKHSTMSEDRDRESARPAPLCLASLSLFCLNQATEDWYTSSPAVGAIPVRPEPFGYAQDRLRGEKSKAENPATIALFDFAAGAATLRANGKRIAQQVKHCANVVCFDLDFRPSTLLRTGFRGNDESLSLCRDLIAKS
jgi:hypothetical protein